MNRVSACIFTVLLLFLTGCASAPVGPAAPVRSGAGPEATADSSPEAAGSEASGGGTSGNAEPKTKPGIKVLLGHSDWIHAVAYSPDGRYALSASEDGTLKLWDTASGADLGTYYGHEAGIKSVAFSPDGKRAVSGSNDMTVRLWDVASGKEILTFRGHAGVVTSVAFSPDGMKVLSGSLDGTVRLWDAASGKALLVLKDHRDTVGDVTFSPDGRRILSCSSDGIVKLRDSSTGDGIWSVSGSPAVFYELAFSRDGKHVLAAGFGGPAGGSAMKLFDAGTGKELGAFAGHAEAIESVAFSPDGRYALSGSYDASMKLWDVESGKELRSFAGRTKAVAATKGWNRITSVEFSPDGAYALSGSYDRTMRLWDVATGSELRVFAGRSAGTGALACSPDGRYVLSGANDGILKLWDVRTGKPAGSFAGHSGRIYSAAFSPDGKRAISGAADFTLKLWDTAAGKELRTFKGHKDVVWSVAFSPDGRYVLSGSHDGTVKLWNAETGESVNTYTGHAGAVESVAFTPDGMYAASCSLDKTVRLWYVSGGYEARTFTGHSGGVVSVACSPNGRYVLSGSWDGTMILWDIETGRSAWTFRPDSSVQCVAYSRDGRFVLSGDRKGAVRLWEIATGNEVKTFTGHRAAPLDLEFSPDGKFVFSGAEDGTMRRWNVSDGGWIAFSADPSGSQWLTFTDDGYWDGSPDCGQLVAMTRDLESWNIDQFAVRNNRPDIVAGRLGAEREALDELQVAWNKRLRRLGLTEADLSEDFTVPAASIVSVAQDGPVDRSAGLSLKFTANGRPLARYNVYVNDVPLFGAFGKPLSGTEASVTEDITLTPGNNKVEASCMDAGGVESFRAVRMLSWTGEAKPDLYYIGFGVSAYADAGLNLGYPAKDARDLEALFRSMEGRDFGNVHARAFADAEVTPEAVRGARALLADAKPEDTFVLFIAGHGIHDADPDRTYYFLTHGANVSDLGSTAVTFDELENLLQGIAPRQKLFLMDTCESGEAEETRGASAAGVGGVRSRAISPATRGLSVASRTVREIRAQKDRYIYNDLVRRSGSIVFSSCLGSEVSYEFDDLENGAFTSAIKTCFADPSSDADKDGRISVAELERYVSGKVPEMVRARCGADQHPTVDRDNIYASFGFPRTR